MAQRKRFGPNLKTADARMVCRDCRRTLDVFRRDGSAWEPRDPRVRRPVGPVPKHQLFRIVPDVVLADVSIEVYRCHRDCSRVVLLNLYDDVYPRCEEGGLFEV